MSTRPLTNFYSCTIESILSGCTKAWHSNCSTQDDKKLQTVVCKAQTITEANLPSKDSVSTARCRGKASNFIKDPSHPDNNLLQPLPSGRRYRGLNTRTSRFRNRFRNGLQEGEAEDV
eukprot:g15082.t1